MNKTLPLLFVLMAFLACRKRDTYRLDRQVLQNVVRDIHLADVVSQRHPSSYRDSLRQAYLEQIMKIHGVNSEDVFHDLMLLQNDLELLDTLYQGILQEQDSLLKLHRYALN